MEKELTQKLNNLEEKYAREEKIWQRNIAEVEKSCTESENKCTSLSRDVQTKQRIIASLQEELKCAKERLSKNRQENDRLYKKLQEMESKTSLRIKRIDSLSDLTNIDLEIDLDSLGHNELIEQCLDLKTRFEKAVIEIRAIKRELRDSHVKYDNLELQNATLKKNLEVVEEEAQAHASLMANRVQDLTTKLATAEKQARNLKSKLQDSREKRRSLSLKGKLLSISVNQRFEIPRLPYHYYVSTPCKNENLGWSTFRTPLQRISSRLA